MIKATALAVGLMLSAAAVAASEPTETVTARAQVIDGATLRLEGRAIRLWGIAVPAPTRADGMHSTIGLFRLVDGRIVTCHINDERDQSAFWGKCEAAGLDVSALMVDGGYARDCPAQSNARYRIQEQRARDKGSELTTSFSLPGQCERKAAARKNPAG
jgi:endonuclease YncB( thermonuclease family)